MSKKKQKLRWIEVTSELLGVKDSNFLCVFESYFLYHFPVKFGLGFREKYIFAYFHHSVTTTEETKDIYGNCVDIKQKFYFSLERDSSPSFHIRDLNRVEKFYILVTPDFDISSIDINPFFKS